MNMLLFLFVILIVMDAAKCLRLLQWPTLNCTQEGLRCSARFNTCLEKRQQVSTMYSPTSPVITACKPDVREDKLGHLVPVLVVKWTARMDGSIKALKGAEVRVHKLAGNQSICLQYVFHNKIEEMSNPRRQAWSFTLDRVVVQPRDTYSISVSHLPNPDKGHNMDIETITIPDCEDLHLKKAKICIESGSLWKPNITWDVSGSPAVFSVGFSAGELSEEYLVSVHCSTGTWTQAVWKENRTFLNVTIAVEQWPRPCCDFVTVQPFFPQCKANCTPQEKELEKCNGSTERAVTIGHTVTPVVLAVVLACGLLIFVLFAYRQKAAFVEEDCSQGKQEYSNNDTFTPAGQSQHCLVKKPKKVLIIYSLDHALYKDIVLKLSAFLRAKCGTEVVLDLLDTAWLGTVGRMQWLDWQKQQIEKSSDKILILCSRGVQAKWRAMCGEPKVMLREDVRSPMGDMFTPAFSLIVPDLLHPVEFGKYMVGYFDDVCSEEDVPPPFNITIKYKLMKHFEELYFRILDKEKHEPGKVNHIEGIAEDEYFNCPSGKALRDAIEAFHAYQLENPDWFEMECMDNEEEGLNSDVQGSILGDLHDTNVMQNVPEWREVPPIFINTVEAIEDAKDIVYLSPLINDGEDLIFTHQVCPAIHLGQGQEYYVQPTAYVSESHIHPVCTFSQLHGSQVYTVNTAAFLDNSQIFSVRPHAQLEQSQSYSAQQVSHLEENQVHSVHPAADDPAGVCRAMIHPADHTNAAVQELYPPKWTRYQEMSARPSSIMEDHDEQAVSLSVPSAEELKSMVALQQSLAPAASQLVSSGEEDLSYEADVLSDWPQAGCVWKRPLSGSDQGYVSRT